MTEDIQPEVLKRTQDTLGKFIKKPVLSEKLLRKPPFRFLHDICTAAMKETGFFEDVLSSNDVKAENIKDKDGKIAFLQKVISAVESANETKLAVKPTKIVAGHEPLKTNEFLQALAYALEKQIENKPAKKTIKKVRAVKSEPNEDDNVKRKNVANKSKKPVEGDGENNPAKKEVKKEKRKSSDKKPEENGIRKSEKKVEEIGSRKQTEENGIKKSAKVKRKDAGMVNGDVVMNGVKAIEEDTPVMNGTHSPAEENAEDTPRESVVVNRPQSAKLKQRTPSARPVAEELVNRTLDDRESSAVVRDSAERFLGELIQNDPVEPIPPPTASPPADVPSNSSPVAPSKSSTPPPSTTPVPLASKASASTVPQSVEEPPAKKDSDTGIVTRPRTAIRPPTARPASARPAAPRIRDRGTVQLQEEALKPATGKVNLIVEQDAAQVDDEELVLVQTAAEAEVLEEQTPAVEETDGVEHGHLVQQILEAQKELEDDVFGNKIGRTEIEWSSRGTDATIKEVERVRVAIQSLTRTANPLGKLIEFLQEDVDTMQRELMTWREKNSSLAAQLLHERSVTDQSIEPLKSHLTELEQTIEQQMEQIVALKATIFRNDEKITTALKSL